MNAEELYERHQVLCALGGVLLHDLRNPLHSATLLIEAMGLRTSDLETLRTRLRAQLAKLDALMSEVAGPMRELALQPRVAPTPLAAVMSDVVELGRAHEDELDDRLLVGEPPDCSLLVDRKLIARAVFEVAARVAEEIGRQPSASRGPVVFRYVVEPSTIQVSIEGLSKPFPEAVAKAPFAIGGGGVGVALARALAQTSSATLRLQDGLGTSPKFVFGLPRSEPAEGG